MSGFCEKPLGMCGFYEKPLGFFEELGDPIQHRVIVRQGPTKVPDVGRRVAVDAPIVEREWVPFLAAECADKNRMLAAKEVGHGKCNLSLEFDLERAKHCVVNIECFSERTLQCNDTKSTVIKTPS